MHKKILMLLSTWDNEYSKSIIAGISDRMVDEDISLEIFNAYDDVEEIYFDRKDREIYTLPKVEQYDGLILTFNSVTSSGLISDIAEKFKCAGKPVVSIDQHSDKAVFCGLDNYESTYELVKHMIEVHHCKTFNYLGGPADHEENKERFRGFSNCLRDHGLEIEDRRILHKQFLRVDGNAAYKEFKELGVHKPDAIICANDYMALGYADSASEDGVKIPDEVKITGFDNVVVAGQYSPSITTIDRNLNGLGYNALDTLLKRIDSSDESRTVLIRGTVCCNESCGCRTDRDVREEYIDLLAKSYRTGNIFNRQGFCRKVLCTSVNIGQLQQALNNTQDLTGVERIALCLNKSFFDSDYQVDKSGYDEEMNMYTLDSCSTVKRDECMYPDEWNDDEKIFLFTGLHFNSQTFGYSVIPYRADFFSRSQHRTYMESISLALENICQRISLDGMNAQLKELYIRDSLTGLYNRFGYAAKSGGFYEKNHGRIYIVYLDLDNLKGINDNYGHATGDMAIKGVAAAMQEAFDDTDILVRMGGDEYLVMGCYTSEEELIDREERLTAFLKQYGIDNDSPVELKVSVGHVFNDSLSDKPLATLVHEADERMYIAKQARKNGGN